jgi:hypothetical protein
MICAIISRFPISLVPIHAFGYGDFSWKQFIEGRENLIKHKKIAFLNLIGSSSRPESQSFFCCGFAQIVSDDLPRLHAMGFSVFCHLHSNDKVI